MFFSLRNRFALTTNSIAHVLSVYDLKYGQCFKRIEKFSKRLFVRSLVDSRVSPIIESFVRSSIQLSVRPSVHGPRPPVFPLLIRSCSVRLFIYRNYVRFVGSSVSPILASVRPDVQPLPFIRSSASRSFSRSRSCIRRFIRHSSMQPSGHSRALSVNPSVHTLKQAFGVWETVVWGLGLGLGFAVWIFGLKGFGSRVWVLEF